MMFLVEFVRGPANAIDCHQVKKMINLIDAILPIGLVLRNVAQKIKK